MHYSQAGPQIAVLDPDRDYVLRLCDYMNSQHNFPFTAQAFTDPDRLLTWIRTHEVHALLLHAGMQDESFLLKLREETSCMMLMLTENPVNDREIGKYQSADALIGQILQLMAEDEHPKTLSPPGGQTTGMMTIAIYSPIGRCGKTTFALALGEVLAQHRRVLYLNMEAYSWFSLLTEPGTHAGDLTDLLYFLREDPGALLYRMGSLIRTLGELDYVLPAFSPGDLSEVEKEEWMSLMETIAGMDIYDVLILDIGTQIRSVPAILSSCTYVFMPVLPDPHSAAKAGNFTQTLAGAGMQALAQRIMAVQVPEAALTPDRISFARELLQSRMGEFARGLCRNKKRAG